MHSSLRLRRAPDYGLDDGVADTPRMSGAPGDP
jgi:hypothetical protein